MDVKGVRRSLFPHLVTISRNEGWEMYHLHNEALAWLHERIKPGEFDYSAYTFRTDFVFKSKTVAFEFKMRWG